MSNYSHLIEMLKANIVIIESMEEQAHTAKNNTEYLKLHIGFLTEAITLYTELKQELQDKLDK